MRPDQSIDQTKVFISINFVVITISDTRKIENDKSGDILISRINDLGHNILHRQIVSDDKKDIVTVLQKWITDEKTDVIIGTGGTGVTGRDVTPEAFESMYDKLIPGFGELFRMLSYESIGTSTIQSRASAGVSNGTYLFALPGSPGACRDAWDNILKYQLDSRVRPCNLVELIPRLQES